jgi:hypothetical protein
VLERYISRKVLQKIEGVTRLEVLYLAEVLRAMARTFSKALQKIDA